MKKTMLLMWVMMMVEMSIGGVICSGNSASVAIDSSLIEPIVDALSVSWDASWIGEDVDSTVVIMDNDVEVKRTAGAGDFIYVPTGIGRHNLTYTTYIDGEAQEEVYTATVYAQWKYDVQDGGAEIVATTQTSGTVVIPSEIDGYRVTRIGDSAFSGCSNLTSITIPSSVTHIGSRAFERCSGLTSIEIPNSVTSIGVGTFFGCSGLVSMTLPFVGSCRGNSGSTDSVFGYIFGSAAFEGGTKITQCYDGPDNSPTVDYYVSTALKSVTVTDEERLGYGAFYGLRGLTNVSINAGVGEIGGYAFRNCTGLTEFVLPDGISEIAVGVFRGCSGLKNLSIPDGVTRIASRAFSECSGLANMVLPDGVTSIGESAFSGCSNLAGLAIPNSVTNIEDYAFYGCGGLVSVTIPNRLPRIANGTFQGCGNLRDVLIPDSVTSIGANAFRNCGALTSIVIPKSVTSIGTDVFSGCSGLVSMTLPFIGSCRGNTGTADSLFGYLFGTASYSGGVATKQYYSGSGSKTYYIPSSLKSVVITDETNLSYGAFYGCNGLTSVILNEGLSTIAWRVFNGCSALVSVVIPDSVTRIGSFAFWGCSALADLTSPDMLAMIEDKAFDGCISLPSREDGYKVVGGWLVGYSDDAAESISDVDDLRGIVGGALEGCTALKSLEFSDKAVVGSIGAAALKGCTELQSLVLPSSLKSIGDEAFMGCSYLGNVIVPGGVKSVGARAFKDCTGFTNAQIEYGVESLGEEAFYGNWQISEVDIPSTVTNIGKSAFGGDSSIIRVGLRGDIRTVAEIFSNYKLIREATVKEGPGAIVDGLFTNCTQLADVRFFGNCPALVNDGSNLYQGTKNTLTTYVSQDSTGWDGTAGSHQLPQAWPLTGSYRKSIAYWDVPTYLVEFDSNGGTLGVQSTYQYSERPFTLPPEPVQTGYRFAGWWTKPSGGLQVTTDTVFIEGVYRRLYAHWLKGHWVFLNPDGGTVTNDFITYIEQTVYGVLPSAVRTGYAFGGWTYNGQTVLPTTPISTAADHTLVAQWEAYKYSVKFNANGGEGEMADEEMTYDVAKPISANAFRRVGYAFAGWSVDAEAGSADFADGESVVSLTAVADGEVVLFAVWKKDGSNVTLETDGDAEWFMDCSVTHDGAVVWRSGAIGDEQRSVLRANVTGPGKISFWWKVDCEWFRTLRLDSLAFSVDGVERQWINGEKDWTSAEFTVEGGGEHVLEWAYIKDESDDEGGYSDCGWVSEVVWEPVLVTLNDYLNCTNIAFSTSGDAVWFGERDVSHDGFGALRSGAVGDNGTTRIDATVGGPGVISFWWKSDCEASFRTYVLDHCAFYVDGVEKYFINDDSGWERKSFVLGEGQHTLAWVYEKDEEGSSGEDCAWLDEVSWSPSVVVDIGGGKNVTIPVGWLSENTERAVTDVAANGRKVWECYVVGLDPEDTTNDFKIVSFPMKADGTPDISAIAFDPPEAKWNVQGATPVLKGKATLEGTGEWQTVTDENKADMRFFKVEVVLP